MAVADPLSQKVEPAMTVEFVGMIAARDQSETRPAGGPVVDPAYLRRFARAHEDSGFDRILVAYGSSTPVIPVSSPAAARA